MFDGQTDDSVADAAQFLDRLWLRLDRLGGGELHICM